MGVDAQCWIRQGQTLASDDEILALDSCCYRVALARLIEWTYLGAAEKLTAFFRGWLGQDATVNYYGKAGLLPEMCVVAAGTVRVIVIAGTSSAQQLAMQGYDGLGRPKDFGTFGTAPLWWRAHLRASKALHQLGMQGVTAITLTGHSYGGAVASILAARIRQRNPSLRMGLVTFGSPKPGDRRLARILRRVEAVHCANDGDIVPHVPLTTSELLAGRAINALVRGQAAERWVHPHVHLRVRADGQATYEYLPTLTGDASRAIVRAVFSGKPLKAIEPHQITTYGAWHREACGGPCWPIDEDLHELLFPAGGAAKGTLTINGTGGVTTGPWAPAEAILGGRQEAWPNAEQGPPGVRVG